MKYAHLADLHLGSWRDEKMRNLSVKAFLKAMDGCLEKEVDFANAKDKQAVRSKKSSDPSSQKELT